jgi:hypothetical protein
VGWPELLLSPCLSVRASGWRKDLAHNVAEPMTILEARLIVVRHSVSSTARIFLMGAECMKLAGP